MSKAEDLVCAGTGVCAAGAAGFAGTDGAVENLRPWLADGARFPVEWIATVASILAQARPQSRRTAKC
jgi:hypothetical protein